jgi:hypothetical protein
MVRSRWRTWARAHTPDLLYDRGLVVPKARDCGDHEWYTSSAEADGCYHCQVTRESRMTVLEAMRDFRKGNRLDGLKIRHLIDEGRK